MKKIELKRHPFVCCPEPGCDISEFRYVDCPYCGKECIDCEIYIQKG